MREGCVEGDPFPESNVRKGQKGQKTFFLFYRFNTFKRFLVSDDDVDVAKTIFGEKIQQSEK